MNAHVQSPMTYEQRLQAEHKARQAKNGIAVATSRRPVPPLPQRPLWSYGQLTFSYHIKLYNQWKASRESFEGNPSKLYIYERAKELGSSYEEVMSRSRKTHIVEIRDQIIYELRNAEGRRQPTFPMLGKLFGRGHSSLVAAYQRAAMRLGNEDASQRVTHKRAMGRKRHEAKRAA